MMIDQWLICTYQCLVIFCRLMIGLSSTYVCLLLLIDRLDEFTILQDGSLHVLLTIIRLVAIYGIGCLSTGICMLYQSALVVYSFFFAFVQRNQLYRAMTVDNGLLSNGAFRFSFDNEKTSNHRMFDRILSLKRHMTDFMLFFIQVIRLYLLGDSSINQQQAVRSARLIADGQSSRLVAEAQLGEQLLKCISQTIDQLDEDKELLSDTEILNLLIDREGKKIMYLFDNKSSSSVKSLLLNRRSTAASAATLLAELKRLSTALIGRPVTFRLIRLNQLNHVGPSVLLFDLLLIL